MPTLSGSFGTTWPLSESLCSAPGWLEGSGSGPHLMPTHLLLQTVFFVSVPRTEFWAWPLEAPVPGSVAISYVNTRQADE